MHYHLIGIKGSGMAALAIILKQTGNIVTGSDTGNVYFTDQKLLDNDIHPIIFDRDNITKDIDEVIVGNAFDETNNEYKRALELNLKVTRYFDFIEDNLIKKYFSIAICGTNGKTTTTGMVSSILPKESEVVLIGDGTGKAGKNPQTFVFEACEYRNTFLHYFPNIALITNIEMDHPDFFKDINDVIDSYQKFANQAKKIIINKDDLYSKEIKHENILTFAVNDETADVRMEILEKGNNSFTFNLYYHQKLIDKFELPFVGDHMIYNSLAAITVSIELGLEVYEIISNLAKFQGVSRRLNIKTINENKNLYLVDDYAHHPTSIELTLKALRQKFPNYELSCIFQAHTFTRVKLFHEDFAKALSVADNVMIDEIFGSIRENNNTISKNVMIEDLQQYNINLFNDIDFLKSKDENHVIAILGAGDIDVYMIPAIFELFESEYVS